MKIPITIGATLLVTAVVAAVFIAAPGLAVKPVPSSGPTLHVTTHTDEEILGSFNDESSNVEFEARMETSWEVSVQVRVGDLVLDASAELGEDGKKKVAIVDGHGKALAPEDKMALIALSGLLERYLEPYKRTPPPHEDLLVRTVGLWSEAPVGHPLKRKEVRSPNNR